MTRVAWIAMLLLSGSVVWGAPITVPNWSFEAGEDGPLEWTLSGGQGEWLRGDAADGERAVAVVGDGEQDNHWRSAPLDLEPSTVYRLRFRGRNLGGQGGTPVTGPVFCNRDLGTMPAAWTTYESIFMTPRTITADNSWLRMGQWHVKGGVAYDALELALMQPVYARRGDLVLGEGEAVNGTQYTFSAPFNGESRNQSRPLAYHQCTFNTNRWVFGEGSEVVYRHVLGGRRQTGATIQPGVSWYAGGELAVEVSADGQNWVEAGALGQDSGPALAVPEALLPAEEVWVRLRARAKEGAGPGSFQVNSYEYKASLEGEPVEMRGATRFVAVAFADERLAMTVESLGDGVPGGENRFAARVQNDSGQALAARAVLSVRQEGRQPAVFEQPVTLAQGEQVVGVDYRLPGTGLHELQFALMVGDTPALTANASLWVAAFFDASYGERLPGSTEDVALWWASSGWKVSRERPAPEAQGEAVRISAARKEAEAAQVVVRPARALHGFTARASALAGPGGATIPAERVEVLKVRYVPVERPTDATGVAAPWPDPLPPISVPITLEAGKNQPLWVRVTVPRDAPAGEYRGTIRLAAQGFSREVPLRLRVYGFELPDRMTCASSFGFSPGTVWQYQRVTDAAQRREVLDKYWRNFSAHHISPYDPAPMDPLRVTWPGMGSWSGGLRDTETRHGGQSSLLVVDDSPTAQASANYDVPIPIPPQGLRLAFWYKTKEPGQATIVTLQHHDAGGQWMSGRNNDLRIEGNGEWQQFEQTVTRFPEGAASVRLALWAAPWADDGSPMGTVWYDDLSLQDAGTGEELVEGGDFEPVPPEALKPTFDWTAWDAAMARAMDEFHFSSFMVQVPGLGGGTFHSRVEPSLLGFGEDTQEYKNALRAYLQALEAHLREKGWLDEAYVYWFDEPEPKDYEFVMNGFRKLKEYAPGLRRMLTEQVEPELIGGPNVWCPVTPAYDHERAEERRKAGEVFWWYICTGPQAPYCTLFIDHAGTELRVWLWQTWQRRIEAVLVWQTNYWTSSCAYPDPTRPQNPYEDPMGWVSGYSTPAGVRLPWGNGDGRFIYPPEAAADAQQEETVLDGPVDSIRWEMLRDGIEDYEYLAMLERLLKAKGDGLAAGEREAYAALLEVPASITSDMTTFTTDPAPIEARRDEIARAIEKLSGR